MTIPTERTITTFAATCLDFFGFGSSVCAAELGMAYRAWISDLRLSDNEIVRRLQFATQPGAIVIYRFGGSVWVQGAQLTGVGRDMAYEGWTLHLEHRESPTVEVGG